MSKADMDEYDLAYQSKKDCDLKYSCPFSILELLLSYDQNSITWRCIHLSTDWVDENKES